MNSRYSATCQQYPRGTLPWFLWWFKQTSCSYAVISWPFILKPYLLAFAYYLLLSCHCHPRLFLPTAKSYQQNTQPLVPGSAWFWYQVSCTGALPLGQRTDMLLLKAVPQLGVTAQQLCPPLEQFPRQHIHTANESNWRKKRENLLHFQFVILLKC